MKFRVIDTKTGQSPELEEIALNERWAKGLIYCSVAGFAIAENGDLLLLDTCGKYACCLEGRFRVDFGERSDE